jgi:hypothetical protein
VPAESPRLDAELTVVVPVLGPERAAGLTVEGERGDLPPRGVVVGAHVALQRELLVEPRVRRRRVEQSEDAEQSEDGTPFRWLAEGGAMRLCTRGGGVTTDLFIVAMRWWARVL